MGMKKVVELYETPVPVQYGSYVGATNSGPVNTWSVVPTSVQPVSPVVSDVMYSE